MWVQNPACGYGFSPSPPSRLPGNGEEGDNVAFRRLVVRPSRLHSAGETHYKLRHGGEGRRFGASFPEAVVTRGRVAKPFLFDSLSLLLHSFRFETRRFTPCRFRFAMGGRVLHERNAGGGFVCEAGASHQPMAHHFVRPLPRLRREEGMEVRRLNRPDIAALSTHNRAAHPHSERSEESAGVPVDSSLRSE